MAATVPRSSSAAPGFAPCWQKPAWLSRWLVGGLLPRIALLPRHPRRHRRDQPTDVGILRSSGRAGIAVDHMARLFFHRIPVPLTSLVGTAIAVITPAQLHAIVGI